MRGARLKYTHNRNATESSERVCHHTFIGPVNVTTALAVAGWVLCCFGHIACFVFANTGRSGDAGPGLFFSFPGNMKDCYFVLQHMHPILYTCGGVPFTWRWVSMYNNGHPLSWTKSRCLEENGPSISNSDDLLLSPGVQVQLLIAIQEGGSFLRK